MPDSWSDLFPRSEEEPLPVPPSAQPGGRWTETITQEQYAEYCATGRVDHIQKAALAGPEPSAAEIGQAWLDSIRDNPIGSDRAYFDQLGPD